MKWGVGVDVTLKRCVFIDQVGRTDNQQYVAGLEVLRGVVVPFRRISGHDFEPLDKGRTSRHTISHGCSQQIGPLFGCEKTTSAIG